MTTSAFLGISDFELMAEELDRHLPLLAPVGDAVLAHLPPLAEGATVLDAACGTGEPGLTLARRSPVKLLGVDGATAMIEIARSKAAREGLLNARFEVMRTEKLAVTDATVDAVISRFGLLMLGDVAGGARELRRVLRPGGAFSLAVWDDVETNTFVRAVTTALGPLVPAETLGPFQRMPGDQAGAQLREVGLAHAQSETFTWRYDFEGDDAAWEMVAGPGIFAGAYRTLDDKARSEARERFLELLASHRSPDGAYSIPHTCRLWWGTQPS